MLGILLACLGWRIFKILSFPFLYLWLLVPTGTLVLPQLQEIATLISSSLLRWIGIPVFVDGFFLEVPSGRYHIEPGCAGLNFLLATAALAPLYAYLFYRSFWKRLVVVGLALILAIIMNGVRIAGIIALAHWGGPKLNIVDNHLLYGWGFFALVLLAAGYVGSYFAEAPLAAPTLEKPELALRQDIARNPGTNRGLRFAFLARRRVRSKPCPKAYPVLHQYLLIRIQTRLEVPGWANVPWSSDWSPAFANADQKIKQSYAWNGETVDLFIATYSRQTLGHELIAYDNRMIDQTRWSTVSQRHRNIICGSRTLPVIELEVASDDRHRHVWSFYWVDGTFTAYPLVAKLLEVKAKLFFGDPRAAIVAVATSEASKGSADTALHSFLEAHSLRLKPCCKLPRLPRQPLQLSRLVFRVRSRRNFRFPRAISPEPRAYRPYGRSLASSRPGWRRLSPRARHRARPPTTSDH